MAAFEYIALNQQGKRCKGVLEADTARQIRAQLRDKRLTPLEVNPVVRKGKGATIGFKLGRSIKTADLSLVTRQLATLIDASIPVEEALHAAAEQVEKPKIRSMLIAIRARVVEGHTLADALGEFPHAFDQLFRSMVAAGERSGHLGPVLNRLADYVERRQEVRTKIQVAMMYPIILVIVAIGVVSGLLAYVVPKIVSQFQTLNVELPFLTRAVINLSDFIRNYYWLVALLIVAALYFRHWYLSSDKRRLGMHQMILHLPVIGKISRGLNSARFARTMAILTSSGVPVLEGMNICAQVLLNLKLRHAVEKAAVRVREGSSMSRALKETKQFPPLMMHMIASGENSGELEQMLERIASNQEREFETLINVALGLFEPLIILVMGLVITLVVLAILLPIFQMNDLITQ